MNKILPSKSIFGLKILNSRDSIVFLYLLLFFIYLLKSQFGFSPVQIIAGKLFILIGNSSILILVLNSFLQASYQKKYIYWFCLTLPILIFLPSLLENLFEAIIFLSKAFIEKYFL